MNRLEMVLPIAARSKERPGFSGKTRVPYSTDGYRNWKNAVRELVERLYNPPILTCRLRVSIEFRSPNEPRGDLDNLIGGIFDALQRDQQGPLRDAPIEFWVGRVVYLNDAQIREFGFVRWVPAPVKEIYVLLEEIPVPDAWVPEKKSRRKAPGPA